MVESPRLSAYGAGLLSLYASPAGAAGVVLGAALYSLGFSRPGDQLYRQATISALLWALGAVALGYSARAELG